MQEKTLKSYLTKLDELNVITLEIYYSAKKVKDVVDDIFELLVDAYLLGNDHASEMMQTMTVVDTDLMEAAIYRCGAS